MSFIHRALLYVTRKKGKSILLFTILLVMATFVLTGLSIWKAAEAAQLDLRQSLGGKFDIGIDWENSPYVVRETIQDNEYDEETGKTMSTYLMYSTKQFTIEDVAAIREVEGIKYCNAATECLIPFEELSLFAGTIPITAQYSRQTKTMGVWSTEEAELFSSGALALTEGRHIVPEDRYTAVISRDLAEQSGLKIGDYITAHSYRDEEKEFTGKEVRVQIVGFFTPGEVEAFGEMVTTYDKIQNRIFVDLQTTVDIENHPAAYGFNVVNITVEDPQDMERVVSDVKALSFIDWDAFAVNVDNKVYEDAAAPLNALTELVVSLLVVIIVVSAVILALILTLWTKTRIHEIGVFLSMGARKSAIIGQYLTEVLMIAVLAFGLSFFTSSAVAGQIGSHLLKQTVQTETEEGGTEVKAAEAGGETLFEQSKPEESGIDVSVGLSDLVRLYLIGFAVIAAAVSTSSVTVMRLKPREILSKMS